ncbi:MAG: MerR family transcriptional regulator [Burkholderiales bacterium]
MYTIGQLAKHARVNTDSVRFYERQGLIAPNRKTRTGYRLYSDEAVRRIEFIKHAQRCGFSLADIRELLDMRAGLADDRQDVSQFVHEKQAEIEKTMAALKSMSALLSELAATHACTSAWDDGVLVNTVSSGPAGRRAPAPDTDVFRSRT